MQEEPHDARWTIHPTGQWILGNHPQSTKQERQQLVQMLEEEKGAFAYSLKDLPAYVGPNVPIEFQLIENKAMWQPQRQYTDEELAIGDTKVKEMLEADIVFKLPTTNPHAAAVMLPLKRAPDGSFTDRRFAIDLRLCNANTVPDKCGMPLPETLFRRMNGAKFLTKIDMRSGFFALALSEATKRQVAFWWRGKLYGFNGCRSGTSIAPLSFSAPWSWSCREPVWLNAVVFLLMTFVFTATP